MYNLRGTLSSPLLMSMSECFCPLFTLIKLCYTKTTPSLGGCDDMQSTGGCDDAQSRGAFRLYNLSKPTTERTLFNLSVFLLMRSIYRAFKVFCNQRAGIFVRTSEISVSKTPFLAYVPIRTHSASDGRRNHRQEPCQFLFRHPCDRVVNDLLFLFHVNRRSARSRRR